MKGVLTHRSSEIQKLTRNCKIVLTVLRTPLRGVSPQRECLTASTAVAKNQMLQAFSEGRVMRVSVFLSAL